MQNYTIERDCSYYLTLTLLFHLGAQFVNDGFPYWDSAVFCQQYTQLPSSLFWIQSFAQENSFSLFASQQ